MDADFLTRLSLAQTEAEREWLLLEMTMGQLSAEMETAVWAAAIPHWFDIPYLAAILDDPQLDSLDQLSNLSFIEQYPGRGFNMHERSRRYFLDNLWQNNPAQFRLYSARAAAYCAQQSLSKPEWRVEQIYHLLISDPQEGSNLLRQSGMAWQNFPHNDYEQVEALARVALEHREAGRLSAQDENWALYWQAHIDMLYGRDAQAVDSLAQIQVDAGQDLTLIALRNHAKADIYRRQGESTYAVEAYLAAFAAYAELGQTLNSAIVQAAINELTAVTPKGIPQPITKTLPIQKYPVGKLSDTQKIRRTLLDNVKTAWLDGVLQQAVPYELTLDMQAEATLVAPTVAMTLHAPGQMDQKLPHNVPLLDVFVQSGRSLLILGAPGSGKTIALLQLTRQLHTQALADPQASLPLVFNLSSWGQKRGSLLEWLVNEAYLQYQVGRKFARETLLPQGNLTLLLDGLDEVPLAARDACVDAINEFLAQYNHDVVVCSRISDYEALQNRLKLAHAIVLQPLTDQQITAFIEQVAEEDQREVMLERVAEERPLREALRSPLLLNLYPQAFSGMTAVAESAASSDTVTAERQSIFAAFVDIAFTNKKTTRKNKSTQWLAFLAKGMQKAGTTLFFVEELQPTWLPTQLFRRYRTLYGAILGLFFGLFFGPIFGMSDGMISMLFFGLTFGLFGCVVGSVTTRLTTNIKHPWVRATIAGTSTWLLSGLFFGLFFALSEGSGDGLIFGLFFGLSGGLSGELFFGAGLIIGFAISCVELGIQLRERVRFLRPSWQRLAKSIKYGILYGLIIGLIVGLIIGVFFGMSGIMIGEYSGGLIIGLITGLFFALIGGLSGLLGGLVLAIINTPSVEKRTEPGNGVRTSIRIALIMTFLTSICLGVPSRIFDQQFWATFWGDDIFLTAILANTLPVVFTWFGGLAWCQHWALRFVLARQDFLPWQLVPWLDEMVALGLLRRIGGGYIFMHRGLLEYFAGETTTNLGGN